MDLNALSTLALLMYLDEGLVTNLSSLMLSGYINIRTTKLIQDRTLLGNAAIEERNRGYEEDRKGDERRDGFKSDNYTNVGSCEESSFNRGFLENREFIRREEEFQRIYTTFTLHSQLIQEIGNKYDVREFDNRTIREGEVKAGDYVSIHGELTSKSVNSYVDSVLTVFNCFGCDNLNKMIPQNSKEKCCMDFNSMNVFMNHLSEILNKNSTEDLILICGDTQVVLNVNDNYFMNNKSYVYDRVDCPCTVFGKVIKVAKSGECVSLLRKTAQQEYYEKVLGNFCTYCDAMTSSGIVIPEMPDLKCEGVSLVVVPISISI